MYHLVTYLLFVSSPEYKHYENMDYICTPEPWTGLVQYLGLSTYLFNKWMNELMQIFKINVQSKCQIEDLAYNPLNF